MKRLGPYLLFVVLVLGVAGCSGKDADPVGTWVMYYDKGCNGGQSRLEWHIQGNETFFDNNHDSGTWSVDEKDFALNYYKGWYFFGSIDDDWMSGSFSGISSGCWSAQRVSDNP